MPGSLPQAATTPCVLNYRGPRPLPTTTTTTTHPFLTRTYILSIILDANTWFCTITSVATLHGLIQRALGHFIYIASGSGTRSNRVIWVDRHVGARVIWVDSHLGAPYILGLFGLITAFPPLLFRFLNVHVARCDNNLFYYLFVHLFIYFIYLCIYYFIYFCRCYQQVLAALFCFYLYFFFP